MNRAVNKAKTIVYANDSPIILTVSLYKNLYAI